MRRPCDRGARPSHKVFTRTKIRPPKKAKFSAGKWRPATNSARCRTGTWQRAAYEKPAAWGFDEARPFPVEKINKSFQPEFSKLAERAGVEPAVPFWGTYDFQSYTFGHSVTSPCVRKNFRRITRSYMLIWQSAPWPQVRVAHVAAAGTKPGLAPAGAVASPRPFLAPPRRS